MKSHLPFIFFSISNKINITIPAIIPAQSQLRPHHIKFPKSSNILLSPRLFEALEKENNYKFRNTNYNYLRILNSHIKNSYFFSNTNKNHSVFSLKKLSQKVFVKMCVCDFVKVKLSKKIVSFTPKKNIPLLRSNREVNFLNHKNKNKVRLFNCFCENKSQNNNKSTSFVSLKGVFFGGVC